MQLQSSDGTVTENKDSYVIEVEGKIAEEREKLSQHIDKLSGEQLMSSSTDPVDALKQLQRIKRDFEDTMGKLNRYKQYQESLDAAAVEIKELAEFQKKFEVRNNLWTNLKAFREKSNVWFNKAFRDNDANEIVN